MTVGTRTDVFICYSRKDKPWLDRLRVHWMPLEHHERIKAWDETDIGGDDDWRALIIRGLNEAGAAGLSISANWLAADFSQELELPQRLARARPEGVHVLVTSTAPVKSCSVGVATRSGR